MNSRNGIIRSLKIQSIDINDILIYDKVLLNIDSSIKININNK